MSVVFSNCTECKHLIVERVPNGDQNSYKYKCKAFPEGIASEYMFRKQQNYNDFCGNGTKFEKV